MAYIKSTNIKMYPSGYRGLLNNGIKKSYNPESKLNVESNVIRSLKTLLTYGKGDFVITENYNWNEVKGNSYDSSEGKDKAEYNYFNFEFICGGYYFKIIDSYEAFKDLLSKQKVSSLYVAISFADMNVRIPESTSDRTGTDLSNIYITEPHLKNQKSGESAGEQLTASNLNDDASNIIDLSSLDQNILEEDCFTGVSLSTDIDDKTTADKKLHYFKILETDSTGNFVVPQEAKLITDTKHVWGSTSDNKSKSLYDEYETGKIKSHVNSTLEIEGATSVNISTPLEGEKSVNITTPKVEIEGSDSTITKVEGNKITTKNITSDTGISISSTGNSTIIDIQAPQVDIHSDDSGLKLNLTGSKLSLNKQTGASKYINFSDDTGLKIENNSNSSTESVTVNPNEISVGTDSNTKTTITKDNIKVQNLVIAGQKADSGSWSLSIDSTGKVTKKNLTVNSSQVTTLASTKLQFVNSITQDSEGKISVEKANITKIGETSTALQGIARVNSVGGTVVDAHARWIKSTEDSTGGKLYISGVNTLFDQMVVNKEYSLVAEGGYNQDNWFETAYSSDLITINSKGRVSASSFYATSDARLKENIKPLDYNKSILDLPVYTYDYINGSKNNIGCLAQDLQKLYPQLIGENSNGYLTVDNSKVVYLLLEEVKKLKKELDRIKTKLK